MDEDILADAYIIGRDLYRAARRDASRKLGESHPDADLDTILVASARGMQLYEVAYDLCRKIHQGAHTAEAAEALIRKRCPGFSKQTYQNAFIDAFVENR